MLKTETHIYFYGRSEPFSNWNPSPMRVALAPGTRPVEFGCGEQLFMAWKALHFASFATIPKILGATSPAAQKALGREVFPFDEAEWDRVSPRYMFKTLVAKYEQNTDHRQALVDGAGRTFVEASPPDRIWGVGLGEDDPRILDEANWRGCNWLGLAHDMACALFADRERRYLAGESPLNDPRDFFRADAFPPRGSPSSPRASTPSPGP